MSMSVSSSSQASEGHSSDAMADSKCSEQLGAYIIDNEFKDYATSESGYASPPSMSSVRDTSNAIKVKTMSSDVFDTYTIDDELGIKTMFGDVDIFIYIDISTSSRSKPVYIDIGTMSGDINVTGELVSPAHQPPYRSCFIDLHTLSGNIKADLPVSTSTTVKSMSGDISASLHPIDPKKTSDIILENNSGRIELAVYPSILDKSAPLRLLSTTMNITSGNARLTFPTSWEGKIEGEVGRTSTVQSYWPGVTIAREGNYISAIKGHGTGKLYISGTNPTVQLFGEDYSTGHEKKSRTQHQAPQNVSKDSQPVQTAQKRKRSETESQELGTESNSGQKRKKYETKDQKRQDDGHGAHKRKRSETDDSGLQHGTDEGQKRKRGGMSRQEMQIDLPLRQRKQVGHW